MSYSPNGISRSALARLVFALLLGVSVCASVPGRAHSMESVWVIEHVDVIDGVNGWRKAQSVVVRGGTIAEVAAAGDVHVPTNARVIDGRGRYLIPGLWDAHVHLTDIPALDLDTWYALLIANGITSVRDMGGIFDRVLAAREAARAQGAVAPRVYIAGPLVDGPQPLFPNKAVTISSAAEARAEIDSLKAAGVDFIKLYEMLAPDVFTAAVHYAHQRGLRVAAHVPLSMDVVDAAQAGVDSLEHLRTFEMSCSANWSALLSERRAAVAAAPKEASERLRTIAAWWGNSVYGQQRTRAIRSQDETRCETVVAALASNHVFQTPNLTNITDLTRSYAVPEWRAAVEYFPAPVRSDWLADAAQSTLPSTSPEVRAFADWATSMVRRLASHDVKILAGTDAPSHHLVPGLSLHQELALLVDAGLTPMQALVSATLRPAQFMRLQDKLGTIEPGKWADMILLTANPLDDIRNTRSIDAVIKDGRLYDRAALDQMLAALKARNAQ